MVALPGNKPMKTACLPPDPAHRETPRVPTGIGIGFGSRPQGVPADRIRLVAMPGLTA